MHRTLPATENRHRRQLVLHADDFGMNAAVTDGTLQAFEHGLLTSASVLANAPDAGRALEHWKRLQSDHREGRLPSFPDRERLSDSVRPFDLGVHLNLTQGRPLTGSRYPSALLDKEGRFPGVFVLFRRLWSSGWKFQAAIEQELGEQVARVRDCGIQPTHLNGHEYVEMVPGLAEVVVSLLGRFHIGAVRAAVQPRWCRQAVFGSFSPRAWVLAGVHQFYARRFAALMDRHAIAHPGALLGALAAGRVTLRGVRAFLKACGRFRLVEIGMHPGDTPAALPPDQEKDGWRDPIAELRPGELAILLSEELAEEIERQQVRLGRIIHGPGLRRRARNTNPMR